MVSCLQVAYRIVRVSLPQDILGRDADGRLPLGATVYFKSSCVRGGVCKGTVEAALETPTTATEYILRLSDGTREFAVPDAAIAYSKPPLYSLAQTLPLTDPSKYLDAFQVAADGEFRYGSTALLLGALKYILGADTELRLSAAGVAREQQQLLGEQILGVLVVSLLHLALGPVDKNTLYDVVSELHEAVEASVAKASWLTSHDWAMMAAWMKSVLPLPEPEVEIAVEPVVETVQRAFRK